MIINVKKLIRLPVFTASGQKLGRVSDLEMDTETHQVKKYLVSGDFLSAIKYLISPAQVKNILADRIIVDDGCLKEAAKAKLRRAPAAEAFNSILSVEDKAE